MIGAEKRTEYMLIFTFWLFLCAAFWAAVTEWPDSVLCPLIGFLWMGIPLVLTRRSTRRLVRVSAIALAGLVFFYLAAVWGAAVLLGFVGSMMFEVEQATQGTIAGALMVEGARILVGAIAGVAAGLVVRNRSGLFTNEPTDA